MALGMVTQLPETDDETSVSRRQLLAKLDVCMGGRVAEELIFGGRPCAAWPLRCRAAGSHRWACGPCTRPVECLLSCPSCTVTHCLRCTVQVRGM
jgi:hypothetical protein